MTHVPRDCANNQRRRKSCRCRLAQYPRVRGIVSATRARCEWRGYGPLLARSYAAFGSPPSPSPCEAPAPWPVVTGCCAQAVASLNITGFVPVRAGRRLAHHRRGRVVHALRGAPRKPSPRSSSQGCVRACTGPRSACAAVAERGVVSCVHCDYGALRASRHLAHDRRVSSVRAPVREAPAEATGRCAQAIASLTAARVASAIYVDAPGSKAYEACLRDAARMCV
ncbi:hypothetical protein K438DRAFT_1978954 [Mycena galopus ATCC 62051]|nr:hypothetical protein K438DRAFT_1978954 [Mycena galopus ATCC 62051]